MSGGGGVVPTNLLLDDNNNSSTTATTTTTDNNTTATTPANNNNNNLFVCIRQELIDCYDTIFVLSSGGSLNYYNTISSVGFTYGRIFCILLDYWHITQLLLPISIIVLLFIVLCILLPSLLLFLLFSATTTTSNIISTNVSSSSLLFILFFHPFILFILLYVFIIGSSSMIQGIAIIYAGGAPNWYDCLISKTCKRISTILLPLLINTIIISLPILYYIEIIIHHNNLLIQQFTTTNTTNTTNTATTTTTEWMNQHPIIIDWITDIIIGIISLLLFYGTIHSIVLLLPILLIERITNPYRLIKRSCELSKHQRNYICMNVSLLLLLWYCTNTLFYFFFHYKNNKNDNKSYYISIFWNLLIGCISSTLFFLPLLSILQVVLYVNMRVQKDINGFTMDILQTELLRHNPTNIRIESSSLSPTSPSTTILNSNTNSNTLDSDMNSNPLFNPLLWTDQNYYNPRQDSFEYGQQYYYRRRGNSEDDDAVEQLLTRNNNNNNRSNNSRTSLFQDASNNNSEYRAPSYNATTSSISSSSINSNNNNDNKNNSLSY